MVLVFIGTAKPLASFSVAPAFVRLGSALLFFLCGICFFFTKSSWQALKYSTSYSTFQNAEHADEGILSLGFFARQKS